MKSRNRYTNDTIIIEFKKIHSNKYDYSLVHYKTMHTKVSILCKLHGEFNQTPNAHIRQKQGCPKCAILKNQNNQRSNTQDFIKKAKNIHLDRYSYNYTNYGKNAHDKIIITCRIHGNFNTIPNRFLNGIGCLKCSHITTKRKNKKIDNLGWSRSQWIERLKNKTAKLYIIECWNEKEKFYKIGITGKKDLKRRYTSKKSMPYQYKIIFIIESFDIGYIYDLEHSLLKESYSYKYKPKIPFVGSKLECRSLVDYSKIKIH